MSSRVLSDVTIRGEAEYFRSDKTRTAIRNITRTRNIDDLKIRLSNK
jgi:hypothetical protein